MADIVTDAELINRFAQQAAEASVDSIVTKAPASPVVDLPGGLIDGGKTVTTAEVRELNGVDEEAIAKVYSTGKALNLILQRGLLKVGDRDATFEDLDNLLAGDRDAILLGIRKATFGNTVEFKIRCPHCSAEQDTEINLDDDVPVKTLKERTWTVDLKKGSAVVTLPTGVTQKKLFENSDKTSAELNTIILSSCVLSVNGVPSMGASTVLNLGLADRAKIVESILDKNPGPRFGEVKKPCRTCGEDIALPLGFADLFRL